MSWIKHVKKIFYGEIVLNIISIIAIFFFGESFVRGFGLEQVPGYLITAFQWFGVLLIVITYILARTLFSGDERALRWVLEGYLIGDIFYVIAQVDLINKIGAGWTSTAIFGVAITLFLITARVVYLWGTKIMRMSANPSSQ